MDIRADTRDREAAAWTADWGKRDEGKGAEW
jgi:hypothetical protein